MRYYSKKAKTEVLPGIHQITADCVALPDDHPFWQPLPFGKVMTTGGDGLPCLANDTGPDLEARKDKEKAWRDGELKKVIAWLDQIRNDEWFGSDTFSKPYTAAQLNAYRVALCAYPDQTLFPDGDRPCVDNFA